MEAVDKHQTFFLNVLHAQTGLSLFKLAYYLYTAEAGALCSISQVHGLKHEQAATRPQLVRRRTCEECSQHLAR
jgi:hypothetical protein